AGRPASRRLCAGVRDADRAARLAVPAGARRRRPPPPVDLAARVDPRARPRRRARLPQGRARSRGRPPRRRPGRCTPPPRPARFSGSVTMGGIRLDRATKVYPNGVTAVEAVSLTIADGEFMVLVGPSGCGRSTLLRMIAGLEHVTEGRIFIGDQDVTAMQPRARDIAMVFQNYALYPQMTVKDNLGFGLKLRRVQKDERRRRVREVAKMLGLNQLMERKPSALSGGQRQRVAMGRAMVREPKAFLMDEPL